MILKKGQIGTAISAWAEFLNGQGFDAGKGLTFDDKVDAATKAFQRSLRLKDDGVVGPKTIYQAGLRGFHGFSDQPTMPAAPSKRCLDFIKSFELEKLTVYNDGYGFPTVGIGHKVKPEDDLKLGDTITKARSAELFYQDIAEHSQPIKDLVRVSLTQGQYDALVSLVFNIGGHNFEDSSLLARLNRGDYDGARERFDGWIKSNGKVSRGLQRRRDAEQEMWDS
jgi:lysozyme